MIYNKTDLFELDRYFKNIELNTPSSCDDKFIVIRLDGVKFKRVWRVVNQDERALIQKALEQSTIKVLRSIPESFISYIQTDEVSIILNKGYSKTFKLQKLVSIFASKLTLKFNRYLSDNILDKQSLLYSLVKDGLYFDCRAFVIDYKDIHKYVVYRQLFCIINSYNKVCSSRNRRQVNPAYFHYDDIRLLSLYNIWNRQPSFEKYGTLILKEGNCFNVYDRIKFLGKSNLLERFINETDIVSR